MCLACFDLQIGKSDDSTRRQPPSTATSAFDTENATGEDEDMDEVCMHRSVSYLYLSRISA